MALYRFYTFDTADQIVAEHDGEFTDNDAALAKAESLLERHSLEVWRSALRVARFDPEQAGERPHSVQAPVQLPTAQ